MRPFDRRVPTVLTVLTVLALVATLTSCGLFGRDKKSGKPVSVFSIEPGQCFVTPTTVKADLDKVDRTPCSAPHTQEAYATVRYTAADGSTPEDYPGAAALTTFAQSACAQRFGPYVGVSYLDSKLFFTFLLPSARSWQQGDDRTIVCLVTTTGARITSSVKGSRQ